MARYRLLGSDGVERPSHEPGRFAAVTTTGVFGRLTCRSGLRAHARNRRFLATWEDALALGFRPCRLCRPRPDDAYVRGPDGAWRLAAASLEAVPSWPRLPIQTERLTLRAFREDDFDALHAMHGDGGVNRFLYSEPSTRAQTRRALRRKIRNAELRPGVDRLSLAAELRETGELVVSLSLFLRSVEHRRGEIGFIGHPDHGGRGYVTEGAAELLRIGFEDAGCHRIEGRCDGRNTPSARVLERLGMRREAHFVENEWVKGEWTDELVYAILEREWRAARTAV